MGSAGKGRDIPAGTVLAIANMRSDLGFCCGPGGDRTRDQRIMSPIFPCLARPSMCCDLHVCRPVDSVEVGYVVPSAVSAWDEWWDGYP